MRFKQLPIYVLLLLALCQHCCAQDSLKQSAETADTSYLKTELFFGLDVNGKTLSPRKWQRFVKDYIAPRFKAGFTILDAEGFYRNSSGRFIREHTKVVMLVHHRDAGIDESIRYVINMYRELYHQESVLKVESRLNSFEY